MSCKAVRIKLFRRPVGLTIPPRFPCQGLIFVFVFSSAVVAFDHRSLCSAFLELGDHIWSEPSNGGL